MSETEHSAVASKNDQVSKFQCIEAKVQPPEVNDKTASPPPDSQEINATSEVVQCSQTTTLEQNKYDKAALAEHIKRNPDFWCFAFPYEAPSVTYLNGAMNDERHPAAGRPPADK